MGFFDFLKESFNQDIIDRYNYLCANYGEAVYTFLQGSKALRDNKATTYSDKEWIVKNESLIISHHNFQQELKKKAEIEAKMAEPLRFREGLFSFCKKNNIPYYGEKVRMPGEKQPSYIGGIYRRTLSSPIRRIHPIHLHTDLSKPIDYHVPYWTMEQADFILRHLDEIKREDQRIVSILQTEDIDIKYQDEILGHPKRRIYYSDFANLHDRRPGDRKYLVEHIGELDEYIKARTEQTGKDRFIRNIQQYVSTWHLLSGGLRYSYCVYYYPTTCDFEATDSEWEDRKLIWNFKNDPSKGISFAKHQSALKKVVAMMKEKLVSTFRSENLKYLTLVCIPASTQHKSQARFEEFSTSLCRETGMENGYPHIRVIEDKLERRSGGTSIDLSKISFDKDYFKNKIVILFDDVITRGDSMRTMKMRMEQLGATVVGGISIGKTKHER